MKQIYKTITSVLVILMVATTIGIAGPSCLSDCFYHIIQQTEEINENISD